MSILHTSGYLTSTFRPRIFLYFHMVSDAARVIHGHVLAPTAAGCRLGSPAVCGSSWPAYFSGRLSVLQKPSSVN